MSSPGARPRIPVLAVINSSEEIVQLLQAIFQIEGFQVVSGYTLDVKRGRLDFEQLVAEHQPDVVLWDIAIPYEANWAFFQAVAASPAGQRCRFVLTTTNLRALHSLVGEVPVQELVGKPYDLDALVRAVQRIVNEAEGTPPRDL